MMDVTLQNSLIKGIFVIFDLKKLWFISPKIFFIYFKVQKDLIGKLLRVLMKQIDFDYPAY